MKKVLNAFIILLIAFVSVLVSCSDSTSPSDTTPKITSINPDHALTGDKVVIAGQNFGDTKGSVQFNGVNVAETGYVSWSSTSITVVVPNTAKTGPVKVIVSSKESNTINFTVDTIKIDDTPKILSVDSSLASVGSSITLTGKYFGNTKDLTSFVSFNGVKALSYTTWTDSVIKVTVPQNATSGLLTVTVKDKISNGISFNVRGTAPAGDPKIDSLSPVSANQGQKITIFGSNFGANQGNSYVQFSGSVDLSKMYYQSWSGTKIIVEVPAGSITGKVYVVVGGKNSNNIDFTVNSGQTVPVITNLDVTIAQPGQTISINGKYFGATQGTSYVEFNGTKVTIYKSWTDTKIQVNVPDNATTGNVYVYVNNQKSNGISFTVQKQNLIVSTVLIPAGTFSMGSNNGDSFDTEPIHSVTISQPFYMSITEITQAQWKKVMNQSNPSKVLNDNNPVEQVTFLRAVEFCNRLSTLEGKTNCYTINGEFVTCDFTANGYRLPTEAEWEYAARAGKSGAYTSAEIQALGWVSDNSDGKIHEAKNKTANSFGLYDMFGNVFEMCWDLYDAEYYGKSPSTDPSGPLSGTPDRVMRGGSYINSAEYCNPFRRDTYPSTNDNCNYNLGFRVVRK